MTTVKASSGRETHRTQPAMIEKRRPEVSSAGPRQRAHPSREAQPVARAAAIGETSGSQQPTTPSNAGTRPKYRGSLAIRSEPLGAMVFIDGQMVGLTPIMLDAVGIGSRLVRIELEGYERWSSVARVVANQQSSIVASLKRPAQ